MTMADVSLIAYAPPRARKMDWAAAVGLLKLYASLSS
jgi:hypothetical protein